MAPTEHTGLALTTPTDGASVALQPAEAIMAMPAATPAMTPAPAAKLTSLGTLDGERSKAVEKVGKPYKIAGLWYVPKHQPDYDETGTASWYGPRFHGKSTANGEIYNQARLTAAHPTLPMPSFVEVTNLENGRKLVVRVNDRGPYKRGRILDLSARAAQLLGYHSSGTAQVRVRYVGKAPIAGDDSFEQEFLAKQAWHSGAGGTTADDVEADFSASIDTGDPEPDLSLPTAAPAPLLRAPVVAALGSASVKPIASSK